MKGKIIWLVVSCLMVAALVLTSCAQEVTPGEEAVTPGEEAVTPGEEAVTPGEEAVTPAAGPEMVLYRAVATDGTVTEKWVEKPTYGGTLVESWHLNPRLFDEADGSNGYTLYLTNCMLLMGDWAKGPAGSNEYSWRQLGNPPGYLTAGLVAESWELVGTDTIIYHIRHGIHYSLDPNNAASRLVNGREINANDVMYSLNRLFTCPLNYMYNSAPRATIAELYASDNWTVVCKMKPEGRRGWTWQILALFMNVDEPHEVVEKYGDLRNWKNSVGTGPFILTGYVPSSYCTFIRNPDFFLTNPFTGDQLPYLDGVRYVIIPDMATRQAALRSGQVDHVYDINWQDAQELMKSNPELKYGERYGSAPTIFYRTNNPALPAYKLAVRQALSIAIDRWTIARDYWGGHASVVEIPTSAYPYFVDVGAHRSFEDLPASSQAIFSYDPAKAKKMLADAGYPNGFTCKVIVSASEAVNQDMCEIVAGYWAAVGVTMQIQVKEYATMTTITTAHTQEDMMMGTCTDSFWPYNLLHMVTNEVQNYGWYSDPIIDAAAKQMDDLYFDYEAKSKVLYDLTPYLIENVCNYTQLPGPTVYFFWQPWVKNFWGEFLIANNKTNWPWYVCIDQNLKEQMTGKR